MVGTPTHYANKTLVFYDRFHGTQIAYFTKEDTEWLWYLGNRSALLGHVETRTITTRKEYVSVSKFFS